MAWLSSAGDIIIVIATILLAISTIYKFFKNGGLAIKNKVEENREEQLQAEKTRIKDTINEEYEAKTEKRKAEIIEVIKEQLPALLVTHDLEVRKKYLADRERYLQDIKDAVVREVEVQLNAIDAIQEDMTALAESAKDVLREKIMAIYHKNKRHRQLEEHEKEALTQYYKDYKAIGGNSYIDKYYGRMETWDVIPDDYIDD